MPQVTVDVQQAGFAEIGYVRLDGLKDKTTTFARAVQLSLADKVEELSPRFRDYLLYPAGRGTPRTASTGPHGRIRAVAPPYPRNAGFQR